ncbi:MAG: hypothetical protein QNJ46_24950 [Leptolyngbyaceae cyanobacterium MO_188.B28]|nr:hypothetical protein [Leptolyngbyaceae cyanobacterium MO_188.B28]
MEPSRQTLTTLSQGPSRHQAIALTAPQVLAEILICDGGVFLYKRFEKTGGTTYKSVSPQTLQQAFSQHPVDSGWLSVNLIRHGHNLQGNWAISFIPPAQHSLNCHDLGAFTAPLPGLIFIGVERQYHVIATQESCFNPTAEAFLAPLSNVNSRDGQICWGDNTPPIADPQTLLQAWRLFIHSPFTHDWSHAKATGKQGRNDIRVKLKALSVDHRKRYPTQHLVGFGQSVEVFVSSLIQL